ncbi:hypothetical protein ACJIZ3_013288 [Penstemon smallii]|uniref:Uncharacterized protein n=1 Tax=Penstemon smallii TaxID=265156 RepID=A0ABD3UPF0_9LAMI
MLDWPLGRIEAAEMQNGRANLLWQNRALYLLQVEFQRMESAWLVDRAFPRIVSLSTNSRFCKF